MIKLVLAAVLCMAVLISCTSATNQTPAQAARTVRSAVSAAARPHLDRRSNDDFSFATADDDDDFFNNFSFSALVQFLIASSQGECQTRLQNFFTSQVLLCYDSFFASGFFTNPDNFFANPTNATDAIDAICANDCFNIVLDSARRVNTILDCLSFGDDDFASDDDFATDDDDDSNPLAQLQQAGFFCARSSNNRQLCFNLLPLLSTVNSTNDVTQVCQSIAEYGACLGTVRAVVPTEANFINSVVTTCMNDANVDLTAASTATEANPFESSSAVVPSSVVAAVAAVVGAFLLA